LKNNNIKTLNIIYRPVSNFYYSLTNIILENNFDFDCLATFKYFSAYRSPMAVISWQVLGMAKSQTRSRRHQVQKEKVELSSCKQDGRLPIKESPPMCLNESNVFKPF